jgi:hypothetical protein
MRFHLFVLNEGMDHIGSFHTLEEAQAKLKNWGEVYQRANHHMIIEGYVVQGGRSSDSWNILGDY